MARSSLSVSKTAVNFDAMRGGKRKNAGRKKGAPTVVVCVRVPLEKADKIREKMKKEAKK